MIGYQLPRHLCELCGRKSSRSNWKNRRIRRRVDFLSPALFQQRKQKLRLNQRLATGECNTTAGLVVENNILFNLQILPQIS